MAESYAKAFSDDQDTQVGCVIVKDGTIVAMGTNQIPNDVPKANWPTSRDKTAFIYDEAIVPTGMIEVTKYEVMIHAEVAAITSSNISLKDATLYCLFHPCHECAKVIIHAKIKRVIYKTEMTLSGNFAKSVYIAKKMFEEAGVVVEKLNEEK